jgi:hypothetical protein
MLSLLRRPFKYKTVLTHHPFIFELYQKYSLIIQTFSPSFIFTKCTSFLFLLNLVMLVMMLFDLHLLDHLRRHDPKSLNSETGHDSAQQGDTTEKEEEGDVGGLAEGVDEGNKEGGCPPKGNIEEDGEVADLGRVGLVEHDHDDE